MSSTETGQYRFPLYVVGANTIEAKLWVDREGIPRRDVVIVDSYKVINGKRLYDNQVKFLPFCETRIDWDELRAEFVQAYNGCIPPPKGK